MIYALYGGAALQARAEAAFGERHALIAGPEQFGTDLRRYLLVRAQLGLFAAVLSFILLLVIGVPLPALWSFLVFAASFIPNIGTFIAVIPPDDPRVPRRRPRPGTGRGDRVHPHQLRPGPLPPAGRHGQRAQPEPPGRVPLGPRVGVDPRRGRGAPRRAPDGGAGDDPRGVTGHAGISALMRNKVEASPGPEADAGKPADEATAG